MSSVNKKEEGNPAICKNMDKNTEYSASHKRTNMAWFHLYQVPKIVKLLETEKRMVVARGVGRRKGTIVAQWNQVSVKQDE